jgi:ubiquinone/menaquinone biosynthesis C-methylase UbiE
MKKSSYVIRGGIEGRERLRILARVMRPTTLDLLRRVGIQPGMTCLEVGCGGGDLACDMAQMVGLAGKIVATDIDEKKLEIAAQETQAQQLNNVEFRLADIMESDPGTSFDLVHARFLLTHLANPAQALARMRQALRPGGVVVIEDIDFRGHFSHPETAALARYVELYTETVRRRGADANIGPRLPALLREAGFENVRMNVVQPAGSDGEVKLLNPLTMENIADAVLAEGLAPADEVDRLVAELYEFARTPGTVASMPRVVEAWGCRPDAN